ncbi:hypothetical protein CONLIGDRAFT_682369 [Coniochaeta ligniaria NRRL 30616]|uniref:Uncharacterized protein n=1 Tax=Coniochaeta ligniaria NRRL 30616 TaxID=1408157 RepID=A0A1J7J1V8_9PEZI|nr:hypothetical protein CONLIGDRAFT_682369 [Coniochaeta ligniaria NRRL 30616]
MTPPPPDTSSSSSSDEEVEQAPKRVTRQSTKGNAQTQAPVASLSEDLLAFLMADPPTKTSDNTETDTTANKDEDPNMLRNKSIAALKQQLADLNIAADELFKSSSLNVGKYVLGPPLSQELIGWLGWAGLVVISDQRHDAGNGRQVTVLVLVKLLKGLLVTVDRYELKPGVKIGRRWARFVEDNEEMVDSWRRFA